jgi:predicted Zn-dependent protease
MSDSLCVSCGQRGHRYGRNEGMDRYDPMACINTLRGMLEREVNYPAAHEYGRLLGLASSEVDGIIAAAREPML